jgi:hypothetical protein
MIQQLFLCVAFIWGVKALFSEPFILAPVGEKLENIFPRWFLKPLFLCTVCMASFWGSAFYWFKVGHDVVDWFIFCVSVAGINFIISKFIYDLLEILAGEED